MHLKINISGFPSRAHDPTPFSHGLCPGFQYQVCIQVELALDLIRRHSQSVSHSSDYILPSMLEARGGTSHTPAGLLVTALLSNLHTSFCFHENHSAGESPVSFQLDFSWSCRQSVLTLFSVALPTIFEMGSLSKPRAHLLTRLAD